MSVLLTVLLFLHLLSWGALLGLAIGFLRKREVPKGTMHAALSALVTGILMVGVVEMGDLYELNYLKISIKLAVAAAITVIAVLAEKKKDGHRWLGPIAILTVVNVAVAVFW